MGSRASPKRKVLRKCPSVMCFHLQFAEIACYDVAVAPQDGSKGQNSPSEVLGSFLESHIALPLALGMVASTLIPPPPRDLLAVSALSNRYVSPGLVHLGLLLISLVVGGALKSCVSQFLAGVTAGASASLILLPSVLSVNQCSSCVTTPASVMAIAVVVGMVVVLLAVPNLSSGLRSVALLVLAAVPWTQIALVLVRPVLCAGCIFAGIASVLALKATRKQDLSRGWPKIAARAPTVGTMGGLFGAAIFLGLPALNPAAFAGRPDRTVPLVGRSLTELGVGKGYGPNAILLFTVPGCHWCEKAREELAELKVVFREVGLRSLDPDGGLIDKSFGPQLMVIKSGVVKFHYIGFDPQQYRRAKDNHEIQ